MKRDPIAIIAEQATRLSEAQGINDAMCQAIRDAVEALELNPPRVLYALERLNDVL